MNKRTFIGSLSGLAVLPHWVVLAEDEAVLQLLPAECARESPDAMWDARVAAVSEGTSEQAKTHFFQSYAESLGTWTEAKHPEASQARSLIHSTWNEAMSFVVFDVWGGRIHVMPRLPAETEWIIWSGFDRGFEGADVGRYQPQVISNLLAMIFEAQAEPYLKLADSSAKIENCLSKLAKAEKHLPERAHYYFRSHLIKKIGQCL